MKGKKLAAIVTASALALAVGVTASVYAAGGAPGAPGQGGGIFATLHQDVQNKWNALTDDQKQAVYGILDQGTQNRIDLINEYVSLGLIDQATADSMISDITTGDAQLKQDGKMPAMPGAFAAKNLSPDQKAQLRADLQSKLDAQVAAGKMTQDQENQALSDFDNGKMDHGARIGGPAGGMGGHRGGPNGQNKAPNAQNGQPQNGQARQGGMRFKMDLSNMPADQKAQLRADLQTKLNAQVAAGTITQAQEDQYLADFDNGKVDTGLMGGPGKMQGQGGPRGKVDLSKMTDDQKAKLRDSYKTRLDAAVAAGTITQAQEDQFFADFDNGTVDQDVLTGIRPARPAGGMGMGRRGGQAGPAPAAPEAPAPDAAAGAI